MFKVNNADTTTTSGIQKEASGMKQVNDHCCHDIEIKQLIYTENKLTCSYRMTLQTFDGLNFKNVFLIQKYPRKNGNGTEMIK